MQGCVIRPVQEADLSGILEIAAQTGPGFNSLPNNAAVIKKKIACSIDSFSEKIEIEKRFYLFVMENLEKQEVIATAGINAYVGAPCPFYKFKLSTLVLISHSLNQSKKHRILHWVSEHEGATELDALYLKSAYRGKGCGAFISRARFLFIAEFSNIFSDLIIADMRGVSDEKGISPFWEAVGRHFFGMSYEEASYLKAIGESNFVAELMPHYPIYVDLLPETVQNIIGSTHQNTAPAFSMLKKEGLHFRKCVDIFDAGPMLEVLKSDIKSIKESRKVRVVDFKPKSNKNELKLISNTQKNFRVALGSVELTPNGDVLLEKETAKVLQVSINDYIRYSHFR